ncbi:MAG: PorT family protein, partial [Muribaculaceae bacterium]|nr:PorT family protein [Muribaculaceae bacterium]
MRSIFRNPGLYIFLCIIGILSTSAFSQTHYNANISVGVKGGIDLSRVNFTPTVKQGFVLGGNAGVTFRYIEENHFGLIAEINFEQRGWKENFEEYPFSYQRTLNYIQIPFLAHIYFGRRARFFFNAGPEIGFMLGES